MPQHSNLKSEVQRIVESGEDVEQRIRSAVEAAARETDPDSSRLVEISRSTMEAATEAVAESAPDDPESTLRQVIDGLGEGLQRTATATKLAIEQAASEGKTFADEDLRRAGEDMRSLGEMFVQTIESTARSGVGQAQVSLEALRQHANTTLDSIRPSLRSAAEAAASDPIQLAKETASSAVNLSRQAAGALFSSVGLLMQSAGNAVKPGKRRDG